MIRTLTKISDVDSKTFGVEPKFSEDFPMSARTLRKVSDVYLEYSEDEPRRNFVEVERIPILIFFREPRRRRGGGGRHEEGCISNYSRYENVV